MHQAATLGRVAEKLHGSAVEICGAEKAVKQTHPGLWSDAGHEVADYRMRKGESRKLGTGKAPVPGRPTIRIDGVKVRKARTRQKGGYYRRQRTPK